MKHHRYIAEFLSKPWAIMPDRLNAGLSILRRLADGGPIPGNISDIIEQDKSARAAREKANTRQQTGAVAVLPLYGVITQRGNMMDDISGPGSTSAQAFSACLRMALKDDTCGAILIDVDSPGGEVYGIQELAAEILDARNQKPICAIANSLAASAAYWVACCASEFYVTPSGEVGSIGVWMAHMDHSAEFEAEGVKATLISAGKFKTEGNPYEPLDEEAQAFMQSRVDDHYGAFTRAVSRARGVPIAQVRDGMGQGRVLGADAALAEKMVDGIMTFDGVLEKMQRDLRASRSPAMPTKMRRAAAMRHLEILG